MAEYINFEAEAEFADGKDDDEVSYLSESGSSFIDDREDETDIDLYRQYQFINVENDIDKVLAETRKEALAEIDHLDEVSNLCNSDGNYEPEIDDFKESVPDITKFEETLFPKVEEIDQKNENQFCNVILNAILYDKNDKINLKQKYSLEDFEKVIDKNLIGQIYQPKKFKFIIDLQACTSMCYEMNLILSNFGYFLRVFELKKNFRHLAVKNRDEQKIVRQLSSCLMQKFKGFSITSIQQQEKQRKNFKPIDIIYKPTKRTEILLFSNDISKAYSSLHSERKRGLRKAHKVFECYYCNKFFIEKIRHTRHMENCTGKPGVIYNFNNQCLISYQDNFKNKGDLPFIIYFDFETTAPTDNQLDPEQKNVCSFISIYCCISTVFKIRKKYCL